MNRAILVLGRDHPCISYTEHKFHNSSQTIRTRVLDCVTRTDTDIAYVVWRKHQVYERLKDKQSTLYNYICGSLLTKIVTTCQFDGLAKIFVDKSLYGFEREHFDNYLTWKACLCSHSTELNFDPPEIMHIDSRQDRCIQAVDFVAGAIGHKYSNEDSSYYNIVEPRVSMVMDLFEGKTRIV